MVGLAGAWCPPSCHALPSSPIQPHLCFLFFFYLFPSALKTKTCATTLQDSLQIWNKTPKQDSEGRESKLVMATCIEKSCHTFFITKNVCCIYTSRWTGLVERPKTQHQFGSVRTRHSMLVRPGHWIVLGPKVWQDGLSSTQTDFFFFPFFI